jgi:ABC-type uncharacterized transport system ATPase subunit
MDMAFAFAQRITVLYQGSVVAAGQKDEISANPRVQEIYLGSSLGLQAADAGRDAGSRKPGA